MLKTMSPKNSKHENDLSKVTEKKTHTIKCTEQHLPVWCLIGHLNLTLQS